MSLARPSLTARGSAYADRHPRVAIALAAMLAARVFDVTSTALCMTVGLSEQTPAAAAVIDALGPWVGVPLWGMLGVAVALGFGEGWRWLFGDTLPRWAIRGPLVFYGVWGAAFALAGVRNMAYFVAWL